MYKSKKISSLFIGSYLGLLLAGPAHTSVQKMGEEDVLYNVSKKLILIEERLKSQSVLVSPETINWPEMENFYRELMFVAAHDPQGAAVKDTPKELESEKLTEQLRSTWMKLEESVFKVGTLSESEEWRSLKTDIELFFTHREGQLYQPARAMIKTGSLSTKIIAVKLAAGKYQNDSLTGKVVTFRVIDPVIETLSKELKQLNTSVRQLDEIRNPKKVEVPSIYQQRNFQEIITLAVLAFGAGLVLAASVYAVCAFSRKRKSKKEIRIASEVIEPVMPTFDYNEWLKRLEKNLKVLKRNEDSLIEDVLCLSNYSHELRDARKFLAQAEPGVEFAKRLEGLNAASVKIEKYFEKINIKNNTETSRNIMKHLIELCEAIEKGVEIKIQENKEFSELKTA